jgi:hypothetical protein
MLPISSLGPPVVADTQVLMGTYPYKELLTTRAMLSISKTIDAPCIFFDLSKEIKAK